MKSGYENNHISIYVFLKKTDFGFAIVAVYINDLNIVLDSKWDIKDCKLPKRGVWIKGSWTDKICLRFQVEHLASGSFVHQSSYIEKNLKQFYRDKFYPLSSLMVVHSLHIKRDPFHP